MKRFIIAATLMLFTGWVHAADLGGKVLRIGSDTTYPPMEMVDGAVCAGLGRLPPVALLHANHCGAASRNEVSVLVWWLGAPPIEYFGYSR